MSKVLRLLAERTGLNEHSVWRIMLSASARYKTYQIPKRNGGSRLIAQPARKVKLLQRALIETTLTHLPVHEAATAYRRGVSIQRMPRVIQKADLY
jgi:RNA-directed DNA polymerase